MLIVFSEAEAYPATSINGRELRALTEAARIYGCRVYHIPADFSVCETAENALAYMQHYDPPIVGVWIGYIPSVERYTAIYEAALAKGVRLVNTPAEYQTAMEFDRFYPLLGELTPESIVALHAEDAVAAGTRIGYPVFVKGAVKSNKEQGWSACVAQDAIELRALADQLLPREQRSRGRVIVRRLVHLRQSGASPGGFLLGREYRAFVYRGQMLVYGYYWDEDIDTFPLTVEDQQQISDLACRAARRVGTPFVAVDLAQQEDGAWIVIEVGDGQFSGLSHVPVLELWSRLSDAVGGTSALLP
jgi:hypothetical protein